MSIKILFLSQYFPPEAGAPSARTHELCRRWVQKGEKVTVLTGFPHHPTGIIPEKYKGYNFLKEYKTGISIIRTFTYATPNSGFFRRVLHYVSFMFSSIIQGTYKSGKQDVIIATSPQFFVGIAGYIISKFKSIPFIFEVRDLWPESIVQLGLLKNRFVIQILEWIEKKLYENAVQIITVTDSLKQMIVNKGLPEDKISLIKNGVDLNLFDSNKFKNKSNVNEEFKIYYIGTHGLSHALDKVLMTAELLNENTKIHFYFVGEGAEKENLKKISNKKYLKNVIFIDQIQKFQLPKYYAMSDVILVTLRDLPLFKGALPSKMFEIMAMAKPIIISVDGEARDLVENKAKSGIFSKPEDPEDLKNKILYLYNNRDLCKELGENGRKFVEQYFNRDKLADEYLRIIKSTMKSN